MKTTLAALAVSVAALCAAPAFAVTYDAGADFVAGDANGASNLWSYGYFDAGTTDFHALTAIGDYFGRPGASYDTPLIGLEAPGVLTAHPGEQGQPLVLRFTADHAGAFFATFSGMLTNLNCDTCGPGASDGVLLGLGAQSADLTRPASLTLATISQAFTLGAGGGVIDFTLSPKANYGYDSTRIFASVTPTVAAVPEPAAWALMILGFGAAGATLRTQRRRALAA